jgi:hypothetical protein
MANETTDKMKRDLRSPVAISDVSVVATSPRIKRFNNVVMRTRAAVVLLLIGATHAHAQDFSFGADLRASGWQTVSFAKIAPVP